jgi:hypothetical protein
MQACIDALMAEVELEDPSNGAAQRAQAHSERTCADFTHSNAAASPASSATDIPSAVATSDAAAVSSNAQRSSPLSAATDGAAVAASESSSSNISPPGDDDSIAAQAIVGEDAHGERELS